MLAFGLVLMLALAAGNANGAAQIRLGTASGGLAVLGSYPSYLLSFGTVNGLGIGTPAPGLTILSNAPVSMYYRTPVTLTISGIGAGQSGTVTAWISTPFASTAFSLMACAVTSCSTAAEFFPLTTVPVAFSGVPSGSFVCYFAAVVVRGNGPQFPASDTAVLKVRVVNDFDQTTDLFTAALSPNIRSESAVGLTMAASGGLAVNPGTDYSASFGAVNGLGLSPGLGVTVRNTSGGVLYTTPYSLTPQFAGFSQTTGTLSTWVSSPFAAPTEVYLLDSASSLGPWTTVSTSSAAPTILASSAVSGTAVTRNLALFVSSVNSSGAVPGNSAGGVAVNATQTFTLTVP